MARPISTTPPKYRLHKPSGQAVVTVAGRDHYLGQYGSPESKQAYQAWVGKWLLWGKSGASLATVREELETRLQRLDMTNYPPCVYFLCKGSRVVRVGSSTKLVQRIAQHRDTFGADGFDAVYWFPVPEADRLKIERYWMRKLSPYLNLDEMYGKRPGFVRESRPEPERKRWLREAMKMQQSRRRSQPDALAQMSSFPTPDHPPPTYTNLHPAPTDNQEPGTGNFFPTRTKSGTALSPFPADPS